MIIRAVGGTPQQGAGASYSSQLPLDVPEPAVSFPGGSFCFTGKFSFGSRTQCEAQVVSREGLVHPRPNQQTHFLVIGDVGSRDWIHSAMGRKIEYAVRLREGGRPLRIICEDCWCRAL